MKCWLSAMPVRQLTGKQTSGSWSSMVTLGMDWGLLSSFWTVLICGASLTTWPTPPGVGNFLLVGVLCWEVVGLVPVTDGFLAGEGDWVSPVMTGMRDGALVSRGVALDSIKRIKGHYNYSKSNYDGKYPWINASYLEQTLTWQQVTWQEFGWLLEARANCEKKV